MTATALKKEMDTMAEQTTKTWQKVCTKADLVEFSGVAAWIETADGPAQVAIFYLPGLRQGKDHELYALDLKGAAVVASPIYKQHFRLEDGQCLEDESVKLRAWKIEFKGDEVWVEG